MLSRREVSFTSSCLAPPPFSLRLCFLLSRSPSSVPVTFYPGNMLDALSYDILVDKLFFHLDVEDVMAMRRVRVSRFSVAQSHADIYLQVNRFYHTLSYHPAVWKRFLHIMPMPLPPLPPTAKHDITNLTGLEAETVISRAISLEDNWHCEQPKSFSARSFTPLGHVENMVLAPGGHYLVTSECLDLHRFIVLYTTDHPKAPAMPLARIATAHQAEKVYVKYMPFRGVQGIMVSFLQRLSRSVDLVFCSSPF
jgi:hypothetical protein